MTFVASDAAIADLTLLLRGVRLPLDVLGEAVHSGDQSDMALEMARLRVPAEIADRVTAEGALVLADAEGKPIATLADATVTAVDGPGADESTAVLQGRIEPSNAAAWSPLTVDAGDRQVTVVVAVRPFLAADLDLLRALHHESELVVVAPVAGPTPDFLPAATLLSLAQRALDDAGIGPPPHVVPVEIAWRDAATDVALARAVAHALGAPDATAVTVGDRDWESLLAALNAEQPLPGVADDVLLHELRRWRPPRSSRGVVVLFTGLSGSGKSTLASALAEHIRGTTQRSVSLLDGDHVRRLLSAGLGFDHASRDLNVRRIGFVAAEVARHGGVAICAPIAPYAESRAAVRAMVQEVGDFVLVHVSTPLAEVERRDVKGLYARARAGQIEQFTGISDPYDEPDDPDLTLDTSDLSVEEALTQIVALLEQQGRLPSSGRVD